MQNWLNFGNFKEKVAFSIAFHMCQTFTAGILENEEFEICVILNTFYLVYCMIKWL